MLFVLYPFKNSCGLSLKKKNPEYTQDTVESVFENSSKHFKIQVAGLSPVVEIQVIFLLWQKNKG